MAASSPPSPGVHSERVHKVANQGRLGFLASPLETTSADELPGQNGRARGTSCTDSTCSLPLAKPGLPSPASRTQYSQAALRVLSWRWVLPPRGPGPSSHPPPLPLPPPLPRSLPPGLAPRAVSPSWASCCLAGCPEEPATEPPHRAAQRPGG